MTGAARVDDGKVGVTDDVDLEPVNRSNLGMNVNRGEEKSEPAGKVSSRSGFDCDVGEIGGGAAARTD